MLWGLMLEPGKLYTTTLDEEVKLSMAAIDSRSGQVESSSSFFCQLVVQTESSEHVLCTLTHGVMFQQSLDLKLMPREKVTFSVHGQSVVHLVGYTASSPGSRQQCLREALDNSSTRGSINEAQDLPVVKFEFLDPQDGTHDDPEENQSFPSETFDLPLQDEASSRSNAVGNTSACESDSSEIRMEYGPEPIEGERASSEESARSTGAVSTDERSVDGDASPDVTLSSEVDAPSHGPHKRSTCDGCFRASCWMASFKMPKQQPSIDWKAKHGGHSMTKVERSRFLESIYDAVTRLNGDYFPTRAHYDELVEHIFRTYPKMAIPQPNMPIGSLKKLWKDRLMYKFRNNRKRRDSHVLSITNKRRKVIQPKVKSTVRPSVRPQWGMKFYRPVRPGTEDDASIDEHIKWMQHERGKTHPDLKQVALAMDRTLSDRRTWLVDVNPRPAVLDVRGRYPWLFDADQLSGEMMRIQGTNTRLVTKLLDELKKYADALVKTGRGRKKMDPLFSEALSSIGTYGTEDDEMRAMCQAAFLTIPGLLCEDVGQIFVTKADPEPTSSVYLKLDGPTILSSSQFSLVAEGVTVASSDSFFEAVSMWVSSYYIFNLEYPGNLSRTLTFIQKVILNIYDELPPMKRVVTLTQKLNVVNMKGS